MLSNEKDTNKKNSEAVSNVKLVEDTSHTDMGNDSKEKTNNTHHSETNLTNKEAQNSFLKLTKNNSKENEKDIVGNHESSIVTADYIQQSMHLNKNVVLNSLYGFPS